MGLHLQLQLNIEQGNNLSISFEHQKDTNYLPILKCDKTNMVVNKIKTARLFNNKCIMGSMRTVNTIVVEKQDPVRKPS